MRRASRFLPIVVGLLLGYLLVSPPEWLDSLGPWRWLAVVAIVALGLLAFTAYQLSANLPADPALEPAAEAEVSGEIRDVCARFEALGFRRVGPPLTVGISPPALLVAFVHEAERCYASAFRTSTLPPKTAFDCVSVLDGDRGGLTTGAEPSGAVIPAARGSLRQVFPRASVEKVFERHRAGVRYLRGRGLSARAVSASTFRADFAMSFRRQRDAFTAAPLRGAAITLWRAATGRTPHLGPIDAQPSAQAVIRELLTGRREG
jgi:hypothetical protein